jgi:hypothetical protein
MMTTWLAAGYADGSGSAMGRIALVAVAVLAVAAYALLQLKARSDRARAGRRRYDPWDWRTYPPESGPADRDSGAPYGNEESRRPDWRYGYPPGYEPYPLYDQARSPWAVKDDATRDHPSLAAARPAAQARARWTRGRRTGTRWPFQARFRLPKVFVTVTGKAHRDWQRLVVLAADTSGASRC